jgi:3-deoxy-manno-octulosonate cytidylyltransferase (CMP-KDO synthetase)
MIEHVWFRAKIASPTSEIYITTDDKKIARECKAFGANIIMSSSKHSNGLSRIVEVSSKLKWDYFIVLQADELLVLPKNIKKLVNEIQLKKYYDVYCLISAVNIKDLSDENIVKCVTGRDQNIITFFRKNWFTSNSKKNLHITKKVCGVYAISKQAILSMKTGKTQILERNESIEQFRFLELGKRIKGVIVTKN